MSEPWQPDAAMAKSLNEVLAMRKAGDGWGELAKDLGFHSLGSVKQSVEATEARVDKAVGEKPERIGSAEKTEKLEKFEKPEKLERIERPERVERPERIEKPGR